MILRHNDIAYTNRFRYKVIIASTKRIEGNLSDKKFVRCKVMVSYDGRAYLHLSCGSFSATSAGSRRKISSNVFTSLINGSVVVAPNLQQL